MSKNLRRPVVLWLVAVLSLSVFAVASALDRQVAAGDEQRTPQPADENPEQAAMHVHYLEIVTPDVEATCRSLERIHGVRFGEPDAALGNARTAPLRGGGRIGVRAPLRATEEPVVRPYLLVEDLQAAVAEAKAGGGQFAIESMEIPGHGTIAIYVQGGIEHGLWQR